LFDSPADWISPNNEGGYRDNPPVADGAKVIITDTDHLWGIGGSATWVWKSFLRGLNPIFMDPYDGAVLSKGFGPEKTEPIRQAMGQALIWSRKVDLAAMAPRPQLASSKYCLANPGREYLVWLPQGERKVTLTMPAGKYSPTWFATKNAAQQQGKLLSHTGGTRQLESPFPGESLLHVRAMSPSDN
jgi:hypothetical protein